MVPQLRALSTLSEDPGLVPSGSQQSITLISGNPTPPSGFLRQQAQIRALILHQELRTVAGWLLEEGEAVIFSFVPTNDLIRSTHYL